MLELLIAVWNVLAGVLTILLVSAQIVGTLFANVWQCVLALGKMATGLLQILQFFAGHHSPSEF